MAETTDERWDAAIEAVRSFKKRVVINLTFSADLDMVPGWGHQPEDWVVLIEQELTRNSHYNTKVEIKTVEVK